MNVDAPMNASGAEQVVFWLLAAMTVFFAVFTVTRKNPVTAVMSLVGTFFSLAGIYATLSAHFLAILQVLVYAGAIMVLFIFVVMILNREEVSPVPLRFVSGFAVLAAIYLLVKFVHVADAGVPPMAPSVPETFGTVGNIGDLLFRDFLFPFEAISLLLLVAIVGGVVVSRTHQKEVDATVAAAARKEAHDRQLADYPAHDALEGGEGDEGHDAHAHGGGH
ncbi:MAG TPA: NADH-quinone oxidoreductase subunit J [Polyangia bacterium]|nr:NADH-quinone oxidoreductase subunit J [Polyangia bacterium]